MTRFRGMISTQPGSTPLSSFKIVSLEEETPSLTASHGNDIGPYGDQDDELVFIQKLVPETDVLTVRLASRGTRVAEVCYSFAWNHILFNTNLDRNVITAF